jgi:HlyD family secretion protein
MDNSLFRKKTLDRISSPEKIDVNLKIISPKWWIMLLSALILLILFLAWGLFGTLNSRVYGTGVLIRQGGLQVVQSKFNGELLETKIDNNSYVRKGEVVAKIGHGSKPTYFGIHMRE